MKTISLWQPWASFMAFGYKTIETRNWKLPASIKGPIAIHATKKVIRFGENHIFTDLLDGRCLDYNHLPKGAIVCYFDKIWCEQITEFNMPNFAERHFGDYTPGRYMWKMSGLHILEKPFFIRGRQGIWNWDTKEAVLQGCLGRIRYKDEQI